MEDVTIGVLPHVTDKVRHYCADQEMDTDVDVSTVTTSMDNTDITLTRKQWFDIGTTLLNIDGDGQRPEHYGRRIMRKVHHEVNNES